MMIMKNYFEMEKKTREKKHNNELMWLGDKAIYKKIVNGNKKGRHAQAIEL
jgi:hypothetical protein